MGDETRLLLTLTKAKKQDFAEFTRRNLNSQICLTVNGEELSKPMLRSIIFSGTLEIFVPSPEKGEAFARELLAKAPVDDDSKQDEQSAATPSPHDRLLNGIRAALAAHDRKAFERCFNSQGVTADYQPSLDSMEDEIFSWPAPFVYDKARLDSGKALVVTEGKNYTLNGEWTFLASIYRGDPRQKPLAGKPPYGYVLAAGKVGDRELLLMRVPDPQ